MIAQSPAAARYDGVVPQGRSWAVVAAAVLVVRLAMGSRDMRGVSPQMDASRNLEAEQAVVESRQEEHEAGCCCGI
jgi:hypothetical protein